MRLTYKQRSSGRYRGARSQNGRRRIRFATVLPVAANYDIRTIQELLGHSDVETTMIYTHTVPSVTLKEAKSPLDF